MPFEEQTIVKVRGKMIEAVQRGMTIAQVARDFGVSRPTVYEWLSRWDPDDERSLADRSHAPHTQGHETPARIEQLLIAERKRWGFGSKKILQRLREQHPTLEWPHRSTVDAIFDRAGLVEKRKRSRRAHRVVPFRRPWVAHEPGELWTADFKGQFRLGNGRYCYPLTVADQVSRYLIVAHALPDVTLEPTWRRIERALREHGLPRAFHTDNGTPFGHGLSRLSTMSVRLMKLDVEPVFSRPGRSSTRSGTCSTTSGRTKPSASDGRRACSPAERGPSHGASRSSNTSRTSTFAASVSRAPSNGEARPSSSRSRWPASGSLSNRSITTPMKSTSLAF